MCQQLTSYRATCAHRLMTKTRDIVHQLHAFITPLVHRFTNGPASSDIPLNKLGVWCTKIGKTTERSVVGRLEGVRFSCNNLAPCPPLIWQTCPARCSVRPQQMRVNTHTSWESVRSKGFLTTLPGSVAARPSLPPKRLQIRRPPGVSYGKVAQK